MGDQKDNVVMNEVLAYLEEAERLAVMHNDKRIEEMAKAIFALACAL